MSQFYMMRISDDDDLWTLRMGHGGLREFLYNPHKVLDHFGVKLNQKFSIVYQDASVGNQYKDHKLISGGGGKLEHEYPYAAWGIQETGLVLMDGPGNDRPSSYTMPPVITEQTSLLRTDLDPMPGAFHGRYVSDTHDEAAARANIRDYLFAAICNRAALAAELSAIKWQEQEIEADVHPPFTKPRGPLKNRVKAFKFVKNPIVFMEGDSTLMAFSCYSGRTTEDASESPAAINSTGIKLNPAPMP